jgi:hypothetical protein
VAQRANQQPVVDRGVARMKDRSMWCKHPGIESRDLIG